jgi:hypothetical protein
MAKNIFQSAMSRILSETLSRQIREKAKMKVEASELRYYKNMPDGSLNEKQVKRLSWLESQGF